MRIDRSAVAAQKRELNHYADELAEIHTKLVRYRNRLNASWTASEISMLNDEIDRLNRRINRVREELDSIGSDMVRAADEIAAEEEAECGTEGTETTERKA